MILVLVEVVENINIVTVRYNTRQFSVVLSVGI